jgi:hypothetical protein
MALELTAGSHVLAAAAQRQRSPHGDRMNRRQFVYGLTLEAFRVPPASRSRSRFSSAPTR